MVSARTIAQWQAGEDVICQVRRRIRQYTSAVLCRTKRSALYASPR